MFNLAGDWYVAAWDERRREVRDFALHRIRRITLTTERYEIPRRLRLPEVHGGRVRHREGRRAPVEVAIRFAPAPGALDPRAALAPRRRGSRRRWAAGSSCACASAETSELRRWVLQFGAEAEVLSPASLRKAVADELRLAAGALRR